MRDNPHRTLNRKSDISMENLKGAIYSFNYIEHLLLCHFSSFIALLEYFSDENKLNFKKKMFLLIIYQLLPNFLGWMEKNGFHF